MFATGRSRTWRQHMSPACESSPECCPVSKRPDLWEAPGAENTGVPDAKNLAQQQARAAEERRRRRGERGQREGPTTAGGEPRSQKALPSSAPSISRAVTWETLLRDLGKWRNGPDLAGPPLIAALS